MQMKRFTKTKDTVHRQHGFHFYTVSQKSATLTMAITLSILGGFAKFFHCCKEQ